MVSDAHVQTSKAPIYMKQLCRHFGHKSQATFTDTDGEITFDGGVCVLRAQPDELVLRLTATDLESLARLERVIGVHLERFGHRDELAVSWARA